MSKKTEAMKLPSLLSFERKLETSDALMYAGNWSDKNKEHVTVDEKEEKAWKPIPITTRYNRSTQSAYGIDDAKKTEPNPVSSGSDDANLPPDKDTLKVSFSLRIIGNLGRPFACNDPDFEKKITKKVTGFIGDDGAGLKTLALRYAYNIANGRFLWRNRVCAEKVQVYVHHDDENKPLEFVASDFSLKDFKLNSEDSDLLKLATLIQNGLSSDNDFIFFKVDAYVKLGSNQHVFPSQEMNMGEKKKVLFQLDDCAAIHNVKIGNALRTIDDWYGDTMLSKKDKKAETIPIEAVDKLPIAIEPYGSVTQRGRAYRPNDNDLYSLMIKWVNESDTSTTPINDKNFVVANLIRGGVFGGKSE